jgi:glutathione S-transferase fosA5
MSATMTGVTGLNHLTLAVTDIERSLAFYRDILGCTVRATWADGAYLEAGSLWLCLSLDDKARSSPHADYTHMAFSVAAEDFAPLSERLIAECVIWKEYVSEGGSTYFLDPDGHKLEIHAGSLETRLAHYRDNPSKGVRVFDA